MANTVLLASGSRAARSIAEAEWVDYMRDRLPDAAHVPYDQLASLLWNETAWPFGDVGYIRDQIDKLATELLEGPNDGDHDQLA